MSRPRLTLTRRGDVLIDIGVAILGTAGLIGLIYGLIAIGVWLGR